MTGPDSAHGRRVTIIDDNPEMRDVFEDILSDAAFDVQVFSSATADLHALIASRPHLMLVNLRLDPHREELTGLQTIHAARASEQLRDVPIIVCSPDIQGLADAWPDFMERGDIHQMELPCDLTTFEQIVTAALGDEQAASDFNGTFIAQPSGTNLEESG